MPIHRDSIHATDRVIRPFIRRTPVLHTDAKDFGLAPAPLIFKLELFQHSGSFKARGAFANLLLREVPKIGVVAASGGNHGAAVAFAAQRLGIPATIFVPAITSPAKIDRIKSCGANLVVGGERYADALAASEDHATASGALRVHAFEQVETLLGQGTLGLELEADAPGIDTLLVAVGGGGLIGGIAAWYRGRISVVGVEPATSCCLSAGLEAGNPIDVDVSGIAADSLGAKSAGELMFPLAQAFVDRVVLVDDTAIREAQLKLWRVMRLIAEPGGAAAFAALTSGAYKPAKGERVGVLVCGGNTDPATVVG